MIIKSLDEKNGFKLHLHSTKMLQTYVNSRVADMVDATFAAIFTHVRKYGSKCRIYLVCFRFALEQAYVCNMFALCKFHVNPFFQVGPRCQLKKNKKQKQVHFRLPGRNGFHVMANN